MTRSMNSFSSIAVIVAFAAVWLGQHQPTANAFVTPNTIVGTCTSSPSTVTRCQPPKPSQSQSPLPTKTKTKTAVFLSDVPQDETENSPKNKRRKATKQRDGVDDKDDESNNYFSKALLSDISRRWKDDWWPQPPEDQLTLSGDILSLFLYSFTDHFMQDVYLNGILESSKSAADAAHTLDPSGTEITVASTPVWLDPTALGPHVSDQVLFWDLQSKVTPHFTPLLASAGMASVTLATCWIVAGIGHKAFHMRNTLDCHTERVVQVTGQTWITSSVLMILLACASQHLWGDPMAAQSFSSEGDLISMNPIQEWFSVLSRADFEYIFNSLGVVLTWRFLISFLLGGWNKK